MGLITETNYQYYQGSQLFLGTGVAGQKLQCTFDIILNDAIDSVRNYIVEIRPDTAQEYSPYTGSTYSLVGYNEIQILGAIPTTTSIRVRAIDQARWSNYGGYEYVTLSEIVTNFMNIYVGSSNIISSARRSDVIFHAKRALQEFSYDTLKSVKSQELTVPHNLTLAIPQDYVNYVQLSWIDSAGVKHIIYPVNNLTGNPVPIIQDKEGLPAQDNYGNNIESAQSFTSERWGITNDRNLTGDLYFT